MVLELGGNAACVVDRDPGEHLDFIADRVAHGAFFQSGQSCGCSSCASGADQGVGEALGLSTASASLTCAVSL